MQRYNIFRSISQLRHKKTIKNLDNLQIMPIFAAQFNTRNNSKT